MDESRVCIAWHATWHTDSTTTTEIVIGSQFGMASFKIVRSSGGRKIAVYSGCQPATWTWDGSHPPLSALPYWEHKYVEAIHKAAKKWGGVTVVQSDPVETWAAIDQLPDSGDRDALAAALSADEKVKFHFDQMDGLRSFTDKNGNQVAKVESKPRERNTEARIVKALANDPAWGMF